MFACIIPVLIMLYPVGLNNSNIEQQLNSQDQTVMATNLSIGISNLEKDEVLDCQGNEAGKLFNSKEISNWAYSESSLEPSDAEAMNAAVGLAIGAGLLLLLAGLAIF